MLYEDPRGETFISDPGYVADDLTSELPCPSCLTGLMEPLGTMYSDHEFANLGNLIQVSSDRLVDFDGFHCKSCKKRVLIERRAS